MMERIRIRNAVAELVRGAGGGGWPVVIQLDAAPMPNVYFVRVDQLTRAEASGPLRDHAVPVVATIEVAAAVQGGADMDELIAKQLDRAHRALTANEETRTLPFSVDDKPPRPLLAQPLRFDGFELALGGENEGSIAVGTNTYLALLNRRF